MKNVTVASKVKTVIETGSLNINKTDMKNSLHIQRFLGVGLF